VLVAIGEEISEQLDIVPASVRVIRHIRRKDAGVASQVQAVAALESLLGQSRGPSAGELQRYDALITRLRDALARS